jgi:hypothetical protein
MAPPTRAGRAGVRFSECRGNLMTYDWDGRRNRLARVFRMTTGVALLLLVLGLPLLVFV